MKIMERVGVYLLLLTLGICPRPAAAQTDISKFPLSKAIPADAFVAVAARANPEREFLDEYWEEVFRAFHESGILSDIWDLVTDSVDDEQLETIESIHDRFAELFGAVDWHQMFAEEFIHAGRFTMPSPIGSVYEGVMMGRMKAEAAEANYGALKGILKEVVKFAESHGGKGVVAVVETNEDGLTIAGLAPEGVPMSILCVARQGDVIAISFGGSALLEECFRLLRGDSDKEALVATARFKQAFSQLPAAEDSWSFVSPTTIFGSMRELMKLISGGMDGDDGHGHMKQDQVRGSQQGSKGNGVKDEGDAEEDSDEGQGSEVDRKAIVFGVIGQLLNDLDIFDYVAEVEWTDGYRVFTDSSAVLKPNAKQSPFYGVVAGGGPVEKFDRFIPKEADTFSCTSGLNFNHLYRYVRSLLGKCGPDVKSFMDEFDRMQKEDWELDIEKDVLSLFEGQVISVSMGGNSWALMFKVTNEEKMAEQVDRLFSFINRNLGEDQGLILTPTKVHGKREFTQISHPMMMMLGGMSPPLVGCAEGYLVVASSAKTVNRCLQTAAGEHPSIAKNKRWTKEAVQPSSHNVDAISFTDERNTGPELQGMIAGLSMALGMAGMFGQDMPPEVKSIMQAAPPILAKLGPVLGKLDFYRSSAGVTTFDGQKWMTKSVQNYKTPKEMTKPKPEKSAPKAPSAGSDDGDA